MADRKNKYRALALLFAAALILPLAWVVAADGDGDKKDEKASSVVYKIKDRSVAAVDSDGKAKWTVDLTYPPQKVEMMGEYLLAWGEREVVRLDVETGKTIWKWSAKGPKKLRLEEDKLYVAVPDQIVRLDAKTGSTDWRYYVGGEKIVLFEIFGGDRIYVLTDKRAVFVETQYGKALVTEFLRGRKIRRGSRCGALLVLEFDSEVAYYNASDGKQAALKKMSEFDAWKDKKPLDALDDLVSLFKVSSNADKARVLVDLRFIRAKGGTPWLVNLTLLRDDDIEKGVPDYMNKFAAMVYDRAPDVAATAEAILTEMAAADASGRFEAAYITAVMTAVPAQRPAPQALVFGLVKLLVLGDAKTRARTIETLRQLTGEDFGFKPEGTFAERREAVAKWEKWYRENAYKMVWDLPERKIVIPKEDDEKDNDGRKSWP